MLKALNKELFFSPANSSLVGILITMGDVTDIFAIAQPHLAFSVLSTTDRGLFISLFFIAKDNMNSGRVL